MKAPKKPYWLIGILILMVLGVLQNMEYDNATGALVFKPRGAPCKPSTTTATTTSTEAPKARWILPIFTVRRATPPPPVVPPPLPPPPLQPPPQQVMPTSCTVQGNLVITMYSDGTSSSVWRYQCLPEGLVEVVCNGNNTNTWNVSACSNVTSCQYASDADIAAGAAQASCGNPGPPSCMVQGDTVTTRDQYGRTQTFARTACGATNELAEYTCQGTSMSKTITMCPRGTQCRLDQQSGRSSCEPTTPTVGNTPPITATPPPPSNTPPAVIRVNPPPPTSPGAKPRVITTSSTDC